MKRHFHVALVLCWMGILLPAADAASQELAATAAARPQPSFGLSGVEALQREVGGYPLWQYLASFIWVAMAFAVAAILDFIVARRLARVEARSRGDLARKVMTAMRWPVKIGILLVLLGFGVRFFNWPPWVENSLASTLVVFAAVIVTLLAVRLVDLLLSRVLRRFAEADAQLVNLVVPVLGKTVKAFLIVIAALTVAQYLGVPVASILAGLGIGGIAVALAAQNTLANLFGTLSILMDRAFRVGDRIQMDKFDGVVEGIGLRSTRLRTLEGHLVTIPNKNMSEASITNVSLRPTIRQLMTISLIYDTTPDQMKQAVGMLREIFQRHPLTQDAWVYWRDYAASSLDISVVYWCKSTDYKEFLRAVEEINLEIKRRFDDAGLQFAFPTQTVHLQPQKPV